MSSGVTGGGGAINRGGPDGTGLGSTTAIALVARREISTRVRSKAYRVTTIVMIAGVVALTVLSAVLSGRGTSPPVVAVTTATAPLQAPLVAAAASVGEQVSVRTVAEPDVDRLVTGGDVAAALVGTRAQPRAVVEQEAGSGLTAAFQVLARQLALDAEVRTLGGDPQRVSQRVATASIPVTSLQPPDPQQGQRIVLGLVVGILIYVTLLTYGQTVAQGVVEEKTSRVVELLLAAVRPSQLMAGKVLGIGLVSLVQLALVGAVGALAGRLTGVLDIPLGDTIGAVAWAVGWYLLGFLVYALLFAAAGALVSRQEDVGSVTVPILLLIIAPYVVGATVLPSDPQSSLVAVLSVVPFFAPMLMPWRIALDVAAPWQIALSVGLTVALVPVLVWVAARIYTNAVVRTGARVSLREALRPV